MAVPGYSRTGQAVKILSRPIPWQDFEIVLLSLCPGTMKGLQSNCPVGQENPVTLESLVDTSNVHSCFVLKKLYQMVNIRGKLFSTALIKKRVMQKCFINIFWQNAGVWNKIQKGFHSNMPKLSEWNRGPIIKWSCYQGPLEFVSSNLQASKKNPFFSPCWSVLDFWKNQFGKIKFIELDF